MKSFPWAGALALISGLAPLSVHAGNWPGFRGPTGQGHSEAQGLPLEWDASRHVDWKRPLPGSGWSSPILVDGRLYLTAAQETGEGRIPALSLHVLALDAGSGKELWDTKVFDCGPDRVQKKHKKNGYASPTPVYEDGRLYVHFGHMGTACLDVLGKVRWTNTDLAYSPVHGNGGSPALVGDKLFFSCDGGKDPFVVALNKHTGKVAWKTERVTDAKRKFSFSTPLVIEVAGKKQVISPGSGAVCAYDPESGKEIWRARYGEGYSVIPRPVYGLGMIFIGTGYDRPTVMAIRPTGNGDVTDTHVAWTVRKSAPHTPSLLLVGEELYMVSDGGIGSCLDAKTGDYHWNERLGGDYSASPVYADGRIYFQSEQGEGVVVAPGKTFQVLARNDLGERTLASYAVDAGTLYIRGEQHLFCIKK